MSIDDVPSQRIPRSARFSPLKYLARVWPCLAAWALLTGCARHYDITLINGERITNVTRPVLNDNRDAFYYKDVAGGEHHVFVGRVVDIRPHSSRTAIPGTIQK